MGLVPPHQLVCLGMFSIQQIMDIMRVAGQNLGRYVCELAIFKSHKPIVAYIDLLMCFTKISKCKRQVNYILKQVKLFTQIVIKTIVTISGFVATISSGFKQNRGVFGCRIFILLGIHIDRANEPRNAAHK